MSSPTKDFVVDIRRLSITMASTFNLNRLDPRETSVMDYRRPRGLGRSLATTEKFLRVKRETLYGSEKDDFGFSSLEPEPLILPTMWIAAIQDCDRNTSLFEAVRDVVKSLQKLDADCDLMAVLKQVKCILHCP